MSPHGTGVPNQFAWHRFFFPKVGIDRFGDLLTSAAVNVRGDGAEKGKALMETRRSGWLNLISDCGSAHVPRASLLSQLSEAG